MANLTLEEVIGALDTERELVETKIDRLSSFLEQDETMDLVGPYHFDLLMAQRHSMRAYSKILTLRIDDLEEKVLANDS